MKNRMQQGYLLIELLIAILLISTMGVIIGKLLASNHILERKAYAHCKAAVLAQQVLNGQSIPATDSYTVTRSDTKPFSGIPYTQTMVKISMLYGDTRKDFTYTGGKFNER